MMNNMKAYELNELEMDSVAGGTSPNFLCTVADEKLYASLSRNEQLEILKQPDAASRRAKMFEMLKSKS